MPRALDQAMHLPDSCMYLMAASQKIVSIAGDRGYHGVANNQDSVSKAVAYVCQEKGLPYFLLFLLFGTNQSGQKVLLTITIC
jgi:hypothetical protein